MSDIVERLRDKHCCDDACHCDEAANEIERQAAELRSLRAALAEIRDVSPVGSDAHRLSNAALTAQPAAPGGEND